MISIVIPSYIINDELEELTLNAIHSFKETTKDYELILVDDCSTQGQEMLKREADVYIRNEKNLGYAPTMNKGWKVAKGDYIVTANNDIEVYPGWQEIFLKQLKEFDGDLIGGLGFKVREVEGRPIEDYLINPGSLAKSTIISIGGQFRDWMFPGGFFLMTREVLDKIGFFDENYKHGGYEDIDFFYQARLAGFKLLITPKVAYWHKEGATRFNSQEKGRATIAEKHNFEYFIKKWGFDPNEKMYEKIFKQEIINY